MAGQRGHALLDRDADAGGIEAGFEIEFHFDV